MPRSAPLARGAIFQKKKKKPPYQFGAALSFVRFTIRQSFNWLTALYQ